MFASIAIRFVMYITYDSKNKFYAHEKEFIN